MTKSLTGERADLLEALGKGRAFLRFTLRDLTDEQAGLRTTASELCLGGLIKHVTAAERGWTKFILGEPGVMGFDQTAAAAYRDQFQMTAGDTVESVLADYDSVASATDEVVASLPNLDDSHPLPEAPWFEPGACWSARQALLHIIAETAQHAGHADIIRESLDGAKTMG